MPMQKTGDSPSKSRRSAALFLGAIGVVFGDIGTSPLYALRQCFTGPDAPETTAANVMGVMSVMLWSLFIVVCVKYVWLVLRADNEGEGGILALMTLLERRTASITTRTRTVMAWSGVIGAALLYGDGIVTPSISVLSAVEGISVATPRFEPFIVPISIAILVALFAAQRHGTSRVGSLFGPVLCLWFFTIAAFGLMSLVKNPSILQALDPRHAVFLFVHNKTQAFVLLGAVFLTVTGAEVLYADLGHFGTRPIRKAWLSVVMPALVLNYLGQGAYMLKCGATVGNPFYALCPPALLYPYVILATAATVIASQAVISGTFSLARQATQLGIWPRMRIVHTSHSEIGQVYVPAVNAALFVGTIALILAFRESGRLASAYGVAVSSAMLITTGMLLMLCRRVWKLHPGLTILIGAVLLPLDAGFFLSNMLKLGSGGWVIIVISVVLCSASFIWKAGRAALRRSAEEAAIDASSFVADLRNRASLRVPGTAVFFTSNPGGVPRSLLHNYKHNKVLHEVTALLTVRNLEIPEVPDSQRISAEDMGEGFYRVVVQSGFAETPDIPAALETLKIPGVSFDRARTTYFLGKETLVLRQGRGMPLAAKHVFAFMSRNALNASAFYGLPPARVIELGAQEQL
jgi:KUP system potassium uptake protein